MKTFPRSLSFALLFACSHAAESREGSPAGARPPNAAAPRSGLSRLEPSPLADVQAPFVLTIEPPSARPAPHVPFTIIAKIASATAHKTPATLEVTLPAGVKLQRGSAREVLAIGAGETNRSFEFVADQPLDERRFIAVSVDMRDRAGAFGARATRTYPDAAPTAPLQKAGRAPLPGVPAPPVARPGAWLQR